MISNEQRREVAKELRKFLSVSWNKRVWDHDGLQTVGRLVGTSVGENIIERLANLIDRSTSNDAGRGYTFECSECGCRIGVILKDSREGEPAMTVHDDPLYEPHYCPNCGAEVVE